jgi:basic membrane protein A
MNVIYTGSWYDETLEKEGANALIGKGCVLISQHADSMGAPSACELAGVPDVSYNMSMLSACPNTYLVSSKINWEPYVEYIIGCVRDGEDIETDWTGTIKTGSVELTEFNDAIIADGTKELVDATMNAMNAGTLHVFDTSTFTVDGKPLEDDNYVFDGYFHESELGSAPAFAYYIDGITILD